MAGYRSEAAQFARRIVTSDAYFNMLKSRAESGTLAPPVETLLLHYAYGKPVEHVTMVTTSEADIGSMTVEQLAERAAKVHEMLRERHETDMKLEAAARAAKHAEEQRVRQAQQEASRKSEAEKQSVFHKIDKGVH